jgi:hypothetical protein
MTDGPLLSARARFRAHLEALVEQHPELSSGEIADLVAQTLPEEDRGLVTQFLSSEARNILAWELRSQFMRTRQGIFGVIDLANPDARGVEGLGEKARDTLYDRIVQWREFDPIARRSRLIMDMNEAILLASADYDAAIIGHHGWKMHLKTRLAAALHDDASALVKDRFTPEQVASLGEQLKKEMSRGNFRLKITPVHALPRPSSVPGPSHGRRP